MTKRIAMILAGIVIVSSVLVMFAKHATSTPTPPTGLTTAQLSFLHLCTGLEITSDSEAVAVGNCVGRVRGFVDGHSLTVRLTTPEVRSGIELWCVDRSVSDKQLLDAVIAWSDSNKERVVDLVVEYKDATAARTAVMIAALHSSYPCEK